MNKLIRCDNNRHAKHQWISWSVHSSWLTRWFTVISNTIAGISHYLVAPKFARQITTVRDLIDILNKDVLRVDCNKNKVKTV